MRNDDFITASEIAEYVYCNRAWWLKLTGYKTQNREALTEGITGHAQYSQQVEQVQRQEGLGRLIVIAGIVLLIIVIILRFVIG